MKYPNVLWAISQIGCRYKFAAMIGHSENWLSRRLLDRVAFAPDERQAGAHSLSYPVEWFFRDSIEMNGSVWLASRITETKIVLICVLLIAIAYAIVLVRRRRQFDLNELTLVIVDVVAVIAGISMFVHAFKMPGTLSEQAKWTGIAGVCTAMFFFFRSVSVFRKVLTTQGESGTEGKK